MNQGYYRYPTVAGDRLVFACEDDLWRVDARGGVATRLTASFGACSWPRISPDGEWIAFISTDEGNAEVYVMPSAGGAPERRTFLGSTLAAVVGWSADGTEIHFVANAGSWYERETQPFVVARSGGEPRAIGLGHARSFSYGHGNRLAIGRNADDPARWKRYRGGTTGEIWIDALATGEFERLRLPDGNPAWPMWIGERLFFLSDHEGIGNIYSCAPDGSDVTRHTHENEYYARFPSTDGRRVVYAAGGALSCYDIASDTVTS